MTDSSPIKPANGNPTQRVVTTPLPGKVLQVLVKAGDQVKRGQVLVVIEAMKMENDIKCPQDGTVVAVHVTAGQTVPKGEKLATVE